MPLGGLCPGFDARGVAWFIAHVGPGGAAGHLECLPLTVLNFCFHATAVTSEGALLATRDLRFSYARGTPV